MTQKDVFFGFELKIRFARKNLMTRWPLDEEECFKTEFSVCVGFLSTYLGTDKTFEYF